MDNLWYPDDAGGWEIVTTSLGNHVRLWRIPVPKIKPEFFDGICFIYPSRSDAERGSKFGGSGFFISYYPREQLGEHRPYLYIVTNKHVIDGYSCCVRLETVDGRNDFLPTKEKHWIKCKDDDLAILPFEHDARFRYYPFPEIEFVTETEIPTYWGYGAGDDVFMIGRFVTYMGEQTNKPTVRFGNLAVNETVAIYNKACNQDQESLIVEARSIKGYSGSPVFIWKNPWRYDDEKDQIESSEYGGHLLGISWGYNEIPLEAEILNRETRKPTGKTLLQLYPNSGMMNVIPAWKLKKFLASPEVIMQQVKRRQESIKNKEGRAVPADNPPPKTFTRGDFMRDLNKVVRKKHDKEQGK